MSRVVAVNIGIWKMRLGLLVDIVGHVRFGPGFWVLGERHCGPSACMYKALCAVWDIEVGESGPTGPSGGESREQYVSERLNAAQEIKRR